MATIKCHYAATFVLASLLIIGCKGNNSFNHSLGIDIDKGRGSKCYDRQGILGGDDIIGVDDFRSPSPSSPTITGGVISRLRTSDPTLHEEELVNSSLALTGGPRNRTQPFSTVWNMLVATHRRHPMIGSDPSESSIPVRRLDPSNPKEQDSAHQAVADGMPLPGPGVFVGIGLLLGLLLSAAIVGGAYLFLRYPCVCDYDLKKTRLCTMEALIATNRDRIRDLEAEVSTLQRAVCNHRAACDRLEPLGEKKQHHTFRAEVSVCGLTPGANTKERDLAHMEVSVEQRAPEKRCCPDGDT